MSSALPTSSGPGTDPTRTLGVLSSDPEGPVVRFRWRAFVPALEAAGIGLEVLPWPKDRRGRRTTLERAGALDGVVVAHRLLHPRDQRALRKRVRRLAFDFDDALPYRDSHRGATRSRTRTRRFRQAVRQADRIWAGNAYLEGLAREAGRQAVVLPTVVRVEGEGPAPWPTTTPPVVGWIGSRTTRPYLEGQWPVLMAVITAGMPLRLRVIADAPPDVPPGIPVQAHTWSEESWRRGLAGIDIGFAPLPDDAWTRGKCGLKVIQMLGMGRPVIASAVGVQAEQVRHGETGFLTRDREETLGHLQTLLADADLRVRMGEAAWADVRERWSVGAWAPKVVAEVEALLAGERAPRA